MMGLSAEYMTLAPMVLVGVLLALATTFCLLWPLRGGLAVTGRSVQALSKQIYHERLAELNADHMASRKLIAAGQSIDQRMAADIDTPLMKAVAVAAVS